MVSASLARIPKSNIRESTYLYTMPTITIEAFQCTRCAHIWKPRESVKQKPKVCPKCKSPYWDTPRRAKV